MYTCLINTKTTESVLLLGVPPLDDSYLKLFGSESRYNKQIQLKIAFLTQEQLKISGLLPLRFSTTLCSA